MCLKCNLLRTGKCSVLFSRPSPGGLLRPSKGTLPAKNVDHRVMLPDQTFLPCLAFCVRYSWHTPHCSMTCFIDLGRASQKNVQDATSEHVGHASPASAANTTTTHFKIKVLHSSCCGPMAAPFSADYASVLQSMRFNLRTSTSCNKCACAMSNANPNKITWDILTTTCLTLKFRCWGPLLPCCCDPALAFRVWLFVPTDDTLNRLIRRVPALGSVCSSGVRICSHVIP